MLTSDHSMPAAPQTQSRTGRTPAADVIAQRAERECRVGSTATNHSTTRRLVADVDKGSETAPAAASQSATAVRRRAAARQRVSLSADTRPELMPYPL